MSCEIEEELPIFPGIVLLLRQKSLLLFSSQVQVLGGISVPESAFFRSSPRIDYHRLVTAKRERSEINK